MAVTSSGIIILPQAAATAGCSATATVVQEDDFHDLSNLYSGWWKLYSFSAAAARGWVFDHWEQSWDYLDESYGQPTDSGSKSGTDSRNPWSVNNYSMASLNTEEQDYGYLSSLGSRGHWVRTITRLAAVFRSAHTGLILRSATSGAILHGSSNSILRDD